MPIAPSEPGGALFVGIMWLLLLALGAMAALAVREDRAAERRFRTSRFILPPSPVAHHPVVVERHHWPDLSEQEIRWQLG